MNINEFVQSCGQHTNQKQKLASLIIGVNQASISLWQKKGVVPVISSQKVNKNTKGIISLSECNPVLRNNGIPTPDNPVNALKTIIMNSKFDVIYINSVKTENKIPIKPPSMLKRLFE